MQKRNRWDRFQQNRLRAGSTPEVKNYFKEKFLQKTKAEEKGNEPLPVTIMCQW